MSPDWPPHIMRLSPPFPRIIRTLYQASDQDGYNGDGQDYVCRAVGSEVIVNGRYLFGQTPDSSQDQPE